MRRSLALLLLVAAAGFVLAGCGTSYGPGGKPGANVKRRWLDPSEWIVYTSMLPSRSASKAITPLRADEPAPASKAAAIAETSPKGTAEPTSQRVR